MCTDAWASMGQENEKAIREKVFNGYQINDILMEAAKAALIRLGVLEDEA